MKSILLTGIREMALCETPMPSIQEGTDVLMKIEQVGVCGSDVHYYETGRIGDQIVEFPFALGHECAATVEAVGSDVTRVKPGDRIAVDPAMPCFACDQCLGGREHTCRKLRFLGCPGQAEGCLGEYLVMPEASCFLLGSLSFTQGVLCEPLAIGVYAAQQAGVTEGMSVAMLGAGPIGLSCQVSAMALGAADCLVTDLIPERLEMARRHGASWAGSPEQQDIVAEIRRQHPEGLDVVFECAGQQETVDHGVSLLKPGGKLMLIGIPRESVISLNIHEARRHEVTVVNVRRQNQCTQTAIDWIQEGRLQVDFMRTHQFELEKTQDAFELVVGYREGVMKAIVEF